ncbi:MAG: DNA replication/repair protein RecF [Limosilactobacillus sp.]|nr:DNA replication/repair protein RecF [Limosilactobacillus sp.]
MQLTHLSLRNFRNYAALELDFKPGVNVLIGENAQGKTNLLEAIHVLALTRSHRTSRDRDLIGWGGKTALIQGVVTRQAGKLPLELQINSKGKRVKVNHLFQPRLSTYVGHLNVVLFAPEDLELVKGAPQVRRQFMDTEFGQMSSGYLYHLTQYHHQLQQRNQYLKQVKLGGKFDDVLWQVLTEQLVASGAAIIVKRGQLLQQLEKWAQVLHEHISVQREQLTLRYITQVELTAESNETTVAASLMARYNEVKTREIKLGTSLVGPHRDDVQFLVNEQNVQKFGSQGQQRTTALAVKLAEIDLMHEQTGEYPLLLLDDVLSELDDNRQTHLLTAIQDKVQTFLTTTSLNGVAQQLIHDPAIFEIEAGTIRKE